MNSDSKDNEYNKTDIKLWINNVKNNKFKFIYRLLFFLFPIFSIKLSFVDYINQRFWSFFLFAIVVYILNEISNIKDLKERENLKNEIKNKNRKINNLEMLVELLGQSLEGLPKDFLRDVSKSLNLNNSYRISLYVFDEINFRIIGRFSENPSYNVYKRKEYPRNEGYIAKCFENNNGKRYYYRDNLPKSTTKRYIDIVSKETGMNKETIENLSMKSRAYFARLVKDDNKNNVGILMIETTDSQIDKNPENLDSEIERLIIPHIRTMLEISNKLTENESYED